MRLMMSVAKRLEDSGASRRRRGGVMTVGIAAMGRIESGTVGVGLSVTARHTERIWTHRKWSFP